MTTCRCGACGVVAPRVEGELPKGMTGTSNGRLRKINENNCIESENGWKVPHTNQQRLLHSTNVPSGTIHIWYDDGLLASTFFSPLLFTILYRPRLQLYLRCCSFGTLRECNELLYCRALGRSIALGPTNRIASQPEHERGRGA